MVVLVNAELLVRRGSGDVETTFTVFVIVPLLAEVFTSPTNLTVLISPGVKLPIVQVMGLVTVQVPFVVV